MTSRERLLKTINGEVADRVPVTLFIQDHGHYIHQLHPEIAPMDYEQLVFRVVDYQKSLGCDVFARMVFDLYHPLTICFGGVNDGWDTDDWIVEVSERVEGNNLIKDSTITTPDGVLTQTFVQTTQNAGTYVYCCTKKPITNREELEMALKYEPELGPEYDAMIAEKIKRVKDYIGDDGIVGTWVSGGPFNNASMVFDHSELYMLYMIDPEYYERLMTFCLKRSMDTARCLINAGADVMLVGGNVPGGFLGAEAYETFVLEWEKKYIDYIQDMGCPAIYHNCGDIMALVESYKKLGAKVIEPFSPVPLGDADLAKAVEQVQGEYTITGGIDQVNVLQKSTLEDVKQKAIKLMADGKKNGPFIAQTADFLEYNTPQENVEMFVKTALEHAQI